MEEVEPAVNAMPTLCLDRARDHAKRIIAGQANEAEGARRAGRPAVVSIKDLTTDVRGRWHDLRLAELRNHVPEKSNPLVEAHRAQGRHRVGKSNTPEFGAGGKHFQRGLRTHAQSLEHLAYVRRRLDRRRLLGLVTPARSWLAHGSDHGGSLRRRNRYSDARSRTWASDPRRAAGRGWHFQQSLFAAVGAGADGAQRRRSGAVPRHHGGLLSAGTP